MTDQKENLTSSTIEELIKEKKYPELRNLFEEYPEIDIAEACDNIDDKTQLITIFRVVKSEFTAELFHCLNQDTQETIVKLMTDKDVTSLLDASKNDDIVDFLEDMPANLVSKILKNTPKEDREIINKLLNYKEGTAGSIMTTEFLEFSETLTVKETIDKIREIGKDAETIYTIFVKDEKRNFKGTVDLDDLIFAKQDETLKDIMNIDFVTVDVYTDQEKVAELVRRYDLNAIAVLNDDKRLIGIITVDDIVDVIQREANEDMSLQAGINPLKDSYSNTGIFKMAMKCFPWLAFLLIIDVFSSIVISNFQYSISKVAVLSVFIPTIMDAGGNAGSQTSSVMVRSIALNEFKNKDFLKVLWKETRTSLVVATFTAVVAWIWFMIEMYTGLVSYNGPEGAGHTGWDLFANRAGISLLVSVTLFLTIVISKFFGLILPWIAKLLKKDPAVMSGPLITSIVDVSSLLIYFGVFEIIQLIFHVPF